MSAPNRAATNHMFARTLDGYRELAQEYVRTVVPSPEALQQAGYEVRRDPTTGVLLVKIGGVWQRGQSCYAARPA